VSRGRIVALVFDRPEVHPVKRGAIAVVVAVGVHAAAWTWALLAETSLETWSAQVAARVHAELTREEVIDLPEPPRKAPEKAPAAPPPLLESQPEPASPAERVAEPEPEPPAAKPPAPPPAPTEAGRVVAREGPPGPVDLTGFDIVSGEAKIYAGGATVAGGVKIEREVPVPVVERRRRRPAAAPEPALEKRDGGAAAPVAPPPPDRSRPVRLEGTEWRCPWPREADAEAIDEQVVVIRVVVRPDGTAESPEVLEDPGYGFGPAAAACALKTRFEPALDRQGRPIRAPSPPIRVRFTR
jgi:protein TonB